LAYQIAAKDLKCMKVQTPIMYRIKEPDIQEQASRFYEKDYRLEVEGAEFLLRFAGDFGIFRLMKDAIFSCNQLPIRVHELSSSFRL
jgi:threonyl-tRNA synthetase